MKKHGINRVFSISFRRFYICLSDILPTAFYAHITFVKFKIYLYTYYIQIYLCNGSIHTRSDTFYRGLFKTRYLRLRYPHKFAYLDLRFPVEITQSYDLHFSFRDVFQRLVQCDFFRPIFARFLFVGSWSISSCPSSESLYTGS